MRFRTSCFFALVAMSFAAVLWSCEPDGPLFRDNIDGAATDAAVFDALVDVADGASDAVFDGGASDGIRAKEAGAADQAPSFCEMPQNIQACRIFVRCNYPNQLVLGQAAALAGFTCNEVCAAYGARCGGREAQAGFMTCQLGPAVISGTCADVFTANSTSQCRCTLPG